MRWRVGRHRAAIWKSLVLPAGGAALCWLLLMTLWLPVLDYARSYVPVVKTITRAVAQGGSPAACVEASGLTRAQIAALRYHGALDLRAARSAQPQCPWRITGATPPPQPPIPPPCKAGNWSPPRDAPPIPATTCVCTRPFPDA